MKSSFADADQETVPLAPTTALVPTPDSQVVPDSFFSNDDAVEGDFNKSDMKIPRLALVQSVGPLSGELGFTPGTFVYNKEVSLGSKDIKLTLVRLKKYFVEDLPYDGSGNGPMAQFFKTLDDAQRAGFLPIQQKRELGEEHKYVCPVVDADVLIHGVADKAEFISFPFETEGVPIALARWSLRSTAFSRVGKAFFSDSQLALRAGLSTKFYNLSAAREKLGSNFVFCPKVQLAGKNSEAFVNWVKTDVL